MYYYIKGFFNIFLFLLFLLFLYFALFFVFVCVYFCFSFVFRSLVTMKVQTCSFSGFRILPGRGMRFIRLDGHSFIFYSKKCSHQFYVKRNPRKCAWTLLYRQAHRKGIREEVSQKKRSKVVKVDKALAGLSLEEIRQRRAQAPEVRQAQRDAAIKAIKDRMKAVAAKKAEKKAEEKKAAEKAAAEKKAEKKAPTKAEKKAAKKAQPKAKPQASKVKAPKSAKPEAKSR